MNLYVVVALVVLLELQTAGIVCLILMLAVPCSCLMTFAFMAVPILYQVFMIILIVLTIASLVLAPRLLKREAKEESTYEYVIANSEGEPLSYTQFKRVWQYIVTRSTKERTYVRYVNGEKIKHTVTPVLGEVAPHNGKVTYSMDFQVTPHQLRHTYITNLIYAQVDPKTVQYLAGHENSKITMDIYAKVKYNKPKELAAVVNGAFGQ